MAVRWLTTEAIKADLSSGAIGCANTSNTTLIYAVRGSSSASSRHGWVTSGLTSETLAANVTDLAGRDVTLAVAETLSAEAFDRVPDRSLKVTVALSRVFARAVGNFADTVGTANLVCHTGFSGTWVLTYEANRVADLSAHT